MRGPICIWYDGLMLWFRHLSVEFGPVVIFFVVDGWYGFTAATAAMVVATVLGVLLNWLLGDRPPLFAIVSTLAVTLFGAASIAYDDPTYFILSDTILDGLFGLILLGSLLLKKPILQTLFERSFAITDRAWRILSVRWGVFFLLLAATNEFIRLSYSEAVWVNFKLATVFIITAFGCYQFTLSVRERIPGESNWLGLRIK